MVLNELDSRDKKILFVLNKDARIPLSKIAKLTSTPRHVVANHLNRLEKTKIIKAHKLKINYTLLGWQEYEVYLRLTGANKDKIDALRDSLVKNKHVSWVGFCFGNYDIKMSFYARDNPDFYNIFSDSLKGYRDLITSHETVSITKKYKIDSSLFLGSILKEKFNPNIITKTEGSFSGEQTLLDHKDKETLLALGKDPQMSFSELSKHIKTTLQGAKKRVASLERKKIILGTSALINGQKLGFVWATCLFKLNLGEVQEEKLEKYVLCMSGMTTAVRLLGKWDLGISFFSKSIKDLQQSINDFKAIFKDCIRDYDALIILESYKYPLIPECVFE